MANIIIFTKNQRDIWYIVSQIYTGTVEGIISVQSKTRNFTCTCESLIQSLVPPKGFTDLGVSSAEVLWLPEPRSSRRDRGVGGLDSHLIGRFSSLMAESSLLYI